MYRSSDRRGLIFVLSLDGENLVSHFQHFVQKSSRRFPTMIAQVEYRCFENRIEFEHFKYLYPFASN